VILVLLAKTLPQFTVGRDRCSTSGAQSTDRGQRVTVHRAQIDRPARSTAGAEDVEPRRSGDQRGPNGGRPQHLAAGGQSPIPSVDDELRLGARSAVGLKLGGAGLDVEASCSDAHRASIGAPACGVDPAYAFR
jgi:hypothetical protein